MDCIPNEINLIHEIEGTPFFISGSIDLFMGINTFVPFEIKSLREEDFKAEKPILKYVHQLGCYLWLINNRTNLLQTNISGEVGFLAYISKKHAKVPVRLFQVKPSKKVGKEIQEIIEKVKTFSINKKVKKECNNYNNYLAKQCPFRKECWGK